MKANLLIGLLLCGIQISCYRHFDSPPSHTAADLQANISIRDLRAMHLMGNVEKLRDDWIIEGVVVANDEHDNLYKVIVLQDSTAGITIRMDGYGLFTAYPVGRRLAVKLQGLWLGDYARMVQLGAGIDSTDPAYPPTVIPIPTALFSKFLFPKDTLEKMNPLVVNWADLQDDKQSMLIRLDQVEFNSRDTGKPYADIINKTTTNLSLRFCSVGAVYLRTSGYADFAGLKIPSGNGSVTGIYSVFGTEKQLMIRDTSDIQMEGLRCTGGGPVSLLQEDFESYPVGAFPLQGQWKSFSESGNIAFSVEQSGGNKSAGINSFASGQASVITWLVSTPVALDYTSNEVFRFLTREGFDNGASLQVMISTNYKAGDLPWKAKWTILPAVIAKGTAGGWAGNWTDAGPISLKSYKGTISIAFRYEGSDPGNGQPSRTTRFQIDGISIQGN